MPMNPEHLPLLALLVAAVFVGGVALRDLLARRWVAAVRTGAVALLALVLGFVGGTRLGKREEPRINHLPGLVPLTRSTGTQAGTTLLLGGVAISVAPQEHCVMTLGRISPLPHARLARYGSAGDL